MPLRLDVKRKLLARSDRVKCVDLHPVESWMLSSLYNGKVHVWNYENQQMVKSFEVCDLPVRSAKFIARKNWIITGSDDMQIRVFNYNTLDRVHQFEAHSDYVRCIAVHPVLPYVLTASDDMTIKMWDWDHKWQLKQTFEGHNHYVMQVVINPKDNNTFATASLDRTIKVWQLGSNHPNFTLEGHEKGVNCVDYYHGGDKPYIISGADDRLVKIWDYQNKTCVATLDGHGQNVSAVCFHPELPIILTGSEDSTVRLWHANTYRLETTLNYGLERVWIIAAQSGGNTVAIGYDEGSVLIKLGREEPAVSMDINGKILFAKHSEIQQANLKALTSVATTDDTGASSNLVSEVKDGERLPLSVSEAGACEIYPQSIQHSPNGRFVVVCGDGEYIIYTAMRLRNKSYGSASEFVWCNDSNVFAVRELTNSIKVYKNFKEHKQFKLDFIAEGISGGFMLGARSANHLCFYDWEKLRLIRRIEINTKQVFWSENGSLLSITTDDSFYILKYNQDLVNNTPDNSPTYTEDGIEDAFEVLGEINESVKTGLWIGDCFVYTTAHSRLNYYVGGEIVTLAHLDRPMYLLGYIAKDSRLYLSDKDLSIVSYQLLASVLEYQTAVMRRDFDTADKILPMIPKDQRNRVAHFLEKQGFKKQALAVSQDSEHRFDLALNLGELKIAYELAVEAESEDKWRQLSQAATLKSDLNLAGQCLAKARDYGGMLLLASSSGSSSLMSKLAKDASESGQNNVAFVSNFLLGKIDECLELLINTDRLPEAAMFARTYVPSQISRIVALWKDKVAQVNVKTSEKLADPTKYENLFPGLKEAFKAEQYARFLAQQTHSAESYISRQLNCKRDLVAEMAQAELNGQLKFDDVSGQMIYPTMAPLNSASNVLPPNTNTTTTTTNNNNNNNAAFGGAAFKTAVENSKKFDDVITSSHWKSSVVNNATMMTGVAMERNISPTPPSIDLKRFDEPERFSDDNDDDDDDDDNEEEEQKFEQRGCAPRTSSRLEHSTVRQQPDVTRSAQLKPDLVMPSMAIGSGGIPPQLISDTQQQQPRGHIVGQRLEQDEELDFNANLDLDLDNLNLDDIEIEGDSALDEELNLTDD